MKKLFLVAIFISVLFCFTSANASEADRKTCIKNIISMTELNTEDADLAVLQKFTDGDIEHLGAHYAPYIALAAEQHIVSGFEDGTLQPDKAVTRAEFACMLYRAKDFLKSPSTGFEYNGYYEDLSDWNREEIMYCIENGFLFGYGGVEFGSDDPITHSQINTVLKRAKYGLTTLEYYALLEVLGEKSLPFQEIKLSVLDERFEAPPETPDDYEPKGGEKIVTHLDGDYTYDEFEKLLNGIGNQDYEKYRNSEYRDYITDRYYINKGGPGYYEVLVFYDDFKSFREIFEFTEVNQTKRHSIPVIAKNSIYRVHYAFANIANEYAGGYEYFMYESGNILPENIELNKWYRREFVICKNYKNGRLMDISINFEDKLDECDF